MVKALAAVLILVAAGWGPGAAQAQVQDQEEMKREIQQLKKRLEELEKRVEAQEQPPQVQKDVEELKKKVEQRESKPDLAEVISKLHLHGYGEFDFNSPKRGTMTHRGGREWNSHRIVLGWDYEFTDTIRFDTEIEFEDAAETVELEYAHLDFDVATALTVRMGNLLMPVGPLNEFHEPPLFYSVERPYVQQSIIPTTWQENGVGVVGRLFDGAVAYRTYLVAGLEGIHFTTMDGISEGRSGGRESKANDLAWVGRVEYGPMPGMSLGSSLYIGGADQDDPDIDGSATVKLVEFDARYHVAGWDLRGVVAEIRVDGADRLSAATGETIGKEMLGWYLEAAYNVLPLFDPKIDKKLMAFARYEAMDTNRDVPSGFVRDRAADRGIWTLGAAYYPIDKIAIKADIEFWEDGTDDELTRYNLGVGFMF